MESNIHSLVVHEISKKVGETRAVLNESAGLMAINANSKLLVQELDRRFLYSRRKVSVGQFDDESDAKFPNQFKKLRNKELNFYNFTKESCNELKKLIAPISQAKGGFVVFVDYKRSRDYLGIFLIRNKNGQIFKKNKKNVFQVDSTVHIDYEKIAMACRIDIQLFNEGDSYLNFLDTKKEEVSKFFNNWISSSNIEDNKRFNELFIKEILQKIELPKDADGNEIERKEFKEKFRDYALKLPDGNIDLFDLGKRFYNRENIFVDFAEQNKISIPNVFKVDRKILNRIISIKVEADKIKLQFPKSYYDLQKIKIISEDEKEYILIDSDKLIGKIRAEINV